MEKFIKEQLGKISSIKTDSVYFEQSFQKIIASPQRNVGFLFNPRLGYGVVGMALAVLIFTMGVGVGSAPGQPSGPVASLSDEDLNVEVSDADFQIHVKEATYFSQSAEKVASALDEIVSD